MGHGAGMRLTHDPKRSCMMPPWVWSMALFSPLTLGYWSARLLAIPHDSSPTAGLNALRNRLQT